MFHPEAFAGSLRGRGQPHMQFTISHGKWDPHLGAEYLPINPNYGTLTISRYSRPPGGLNLPQIPILGM
jgi:hypothetical protein